MRPCAFLEKSEPVKWNNLFVLPMSLNDVGLSQKEVKRFSFIRALNYLANPGDQVARREAEFEIEVASCC